MPLHDDEMNMRREKREAQRRKQQAEAKRLRITLILAAVVLVLCTAGIVFLTGRSDGPETTAAAETRPTQKPTQATEPATRAQKSTKTTIHIKAAGDLNVTNTVINAGVAVGGYNYTRAFMDVASTLSDADLTVLNLEGNICGEPYGSDTTSAPRELLEGLRNAGVDLIQMANSCTINNGLIGLTSTLQSIRAAGRLCFGVRIPGVQGLHHHPGAGRQGGLRGLHQGLRRSGTSRRKRQPGEHPL